MSTSEPLIVENVRLAYPHIFAKGSFQGKENDKYDAKLILDPEVNAADIERLKKVMGELVAGPLKGAKLNADKLCLTEGKEDREETNGMLVLSASNKTQPIALSAHSMDPVSEEQAAAAGILYGGCYVNVKISLWAQDNAYGKRINANLIAVQHHAEGDRFGGGNMSVPEAIAGFEVKKGAGGASSLLDM